MVVMGVIIIIVLVCIFEIGIVIVVEVVMGISNRY